MAGQTKRSIVQPLGCQQSAIDSIFFRVYPGEDIPIVFLHGAGSNHSIWRFYRKAFKGHTCVEFDLPGHGFSQVSRYTDIDSCANMIQTVLQDQGFSSWVLVGQSLGATIASRIALCCPKQTSRIILISPFSSDLTRFKELFSWLSFIVRGCSRSSDRVKPFVDYSTIYGANPGHFVRFDSKGTFTTVYASWVNALLKFPINLELLPVPSLILGGSIDLFLKKNKVKYAVRKNQNLNFQIIKGHHLLVTHAKEEVIASIKGFIS